MTAPPFFSIVTVALNHLDGLRATQESIAAQACRDYEWVIVDGGSDDGTVNFLRDLDDNVAWSSAPDSGIYDAMNIGIEGARGRYIVFMNAGDCFAAADTLARVLSAVNSAALTQQNSPDFIYGDAIEGGQYKVAKSHQNIARGMFTHHQAMFYTRKSVGDLRYDLRYPIAADYKFTAQFLRRNTNALYVPAPLCDFETGGVSQTNARAGRGEQFYIRRDLGIGNMLTNVALYAAQSMIWGLRQHMPRLYWAMRGVRSDNKPSINL